MQAVRESGMRVEAQLEPSVLTSAAGEDSMSSGSVDMTSSSGDSSSDEGPPLPPPAQFEVRCRKACIAVCQKVSDARRESTDFQCLKVSLVMRRHAKGE